MKNHWVGFEKEEMFLKMLDDLSERYDSFQFKDLMSIVKKVASEWASDLFDTKPCRRRLKYIGNEGIAMEFASSDFFTIGGEYESETFNGGTYTIKGYPNNIGCNYFDVVQEENPSPTVES